MSFCGTCGARLTPDSKFCSTCGTAVAPPPAPIGAVPPPPTASDTPLEPAPPPTPRYAAPAGHPAGLVAPSHTRTPRVRRGQGKWLVTGIVTALLLIAAGAGATIWFRAQDMPDAGTVDGAQQTQELPNAGTVYIVADCGPDGHGGCVTAIKPDGTTTTITVGTRPRDPAIAPAGVPNAGTVYIPNSGSGDGN